MAYQQEYTLDEVLQMAQASPGKNHYAYAVALAKKVAPSEAAIEAVFRLAEEQGSMWLEVVEQMILQDYLRCFGVCIKHQSAYPLLVGLNNPEKHERELMVLQQAVLDGLASHSDNPILWVSFAQLVNQYASNTPEPMTINFAGIVNRMLGPKEPLAKGFASQLQRQIAFSKDAQVTKDYTSAIKVLVRLIQLFKKCHVITLKNLASLQFRDEHSAAITWFEEQSHRIIDIFNYIPTINIPRQRLSKNVWTFLFQDMLQLLYELADYLPLEHVLVAKSNILVDMILSWGVFEGEPSPNDPDKVQDRLRLQFGLAMGEYGDDIPSILCRAIVQLVRNTPCFVRKYIVALKLAYQSRSMLLEEIMIKISIIHRQLDKRTDLNDLIRNLLDNLLGAESLSEQNEKIFCKKLRIMLLYSSLIKEQHFKLMIDTCLRMLKGSHESISFKQAHAILGQLNNQGHRIGMKKVQSQTSRFLKQNSRQIVTGLVGNIEQSYSQSSGPQKRQILLQLMSQYTESQYNQMQVICDYLVTSYTRWLVEQFDIAWRKNRRTSESINLLFRMLKETVGQVQEDYYMQLSPCLYRVLQLLKEPECTQHHSELLQILGHVLRMEKEVSAEMVQVLLSLGKLIAVYDGNMECVLPVVMVLCEPDIAKSVEYSYKQLVGVFVQHFLEFYSSKSNSRYFQLYEREWVYASSSLGSFLQAYQAVIGEDQGMFDAILHCLRTLPECQVRLQLYFIMYHIRPFTGHPFYNPSLMHILKERNTMKLIYLFYTSALYHTFNQQLLEQFVEFHRQFKIKQANRQLVVSQNMKGEFLKQSTLAKSTELFKKLKREARIDHLQYNELVREFDSNI